MAIRIVQQSDGWTSVVAASIPTEDVVVRSKIGYIPQYVDDVYGKTTRATKDVTLTRLLRSLAKEFPHHELISIGTPVNFDLAPTHLTRVEMEFEHQTQADKCLQEIEISDALIRSRIQPAWDWQGIIARERSVVLHVGWYDTVYFLQFKDVFLGDMHCRYSAKFGFDPNDAKITHFRYLQSGDLEDLSELNNLEKHAESIKSEVEFLRVFRNGKQEMT